MKVLIADKADSLCEKVLKEKGLEPVVKTGMTPEEAAAKVLTGGGSIAATGHF